MRDDGQRAGHLDLNSWAAAVARDNRIDVGQIAGADRAAAVKKGSQGGQERRGNGK